MNNNVYKYPKTGHLPTSKSVANDDKIVSQATLDHLQSGIEIICSEKMDGGNVTFMRDAFYARSLDSGTHSWDTRAKQLHAEIAHEIPPLWRISGESMLARRSVGYDNLPGVYMVFGIWDETNTLLSWDDMNDYAEMLNLPVVPLLYRGTSFKDAITAWEKQKDDEVSEGFVLRDAERIAYTEFDQKVAKWVRFNHVRTRADWRHRTDFSLNTFSIN
jgi:hypothetical protein